MEYVLPILIFLFVVVISFLDTMSKKRKGAPQVQSRPFLEDLSILEEEDGEAPAEAAEPREEQPRAPQVAAEGERAIRKAPEKEEPETENPEPKLRIDKKNLILYSEILKPKFDD